MITVKSDINQANAERIRAKLTLVSGKLAGNPLFPTPAVAPAELASHAVLLADKLAEIRANNARRRKLTVQLAGLRTTGAELLSKEAGYVEMTANLLPGSDGAREDAVVGAGFAVAIGKARVGLLPQVENLRLEPGVAEGTLDARWNRIARGLQTYTVEVTTDPAALTGWALAGLTRKRTFTLANLASGARHWVRVRAVGAAGPGAWSDPAVKVAP